MQWTFWIGGTFRSGWFPNRSADLVCIAFIARWADTCRLVVSDLTEGIDPALVVIYTRVFTFLAYTCKCSDTVFVNSALRSTLHERISLKSWWTGTLTYFSRRSHDRVLAARIRVAGIKDVRLYWWRTDTLNKSIANVSVEAGADRGVIPHITLGVTATNSRARIVALVVTTRFVQWTVAVDNTLGLAFNIRISVVERRARADTFIPDLPWW